MSRLPEFFATRHFFLISSLLFLSYSLLRAARSPLLWAATQASWTYEQGFIRRGLFGEIVAFFTPAITYERFFYMAYAILLMEIVLWLAWCTRVAPRLGGSQILISLFFLSPPMVFVLSMAGYLDQIFLSFAIIIAALPLRSRYALPVMTPLCLTGILVHELFLIVCLPVLGMRMLLLWLQNGFIPAVRGVLLGHITVALFCLGMTAGIMKYPALPEAKVTALQESIAARADFPLRMDNFDVLRRDLHVNIAENAYNYTPRGFLDIFIDYSPAMLWVAYVYLVLTLGVLRHNFPQAGLCRRVGVSAFVTALCLLPLLTLAVAWDMVRFFALTGAVGFMLFIMALQHLPRPPRYPASLTGPLAIGLAIFSLSSRVIMLNDEPEHRFPFTEHWEYIREVRSGAAPFPQMAPY